MNFRFLFVIPVLCFLLTGFAIGNNKDAYDICWKGHLNGKIPVFLHYHTEGDVVSGEITYLNTKAKLPIRVIGMLWQDKSMRLQEYEKDGNITGVIIGTPGTKASNGTWYSTKKDKDFNMKLTRYDTLVPSVSIAADMKKVYGRYRYQYGKDGYDGNVNIEKVDAKRASFDVVSVTSAPARNIAFIDTDTINLARSFDYAIPDNEPCAFRVQLFKDFVRIVYEKPCDNWGFGHNATVEGIYYKVD